MYKEQPIFVPPMVHVPQVPPHIVAQRRQSCINPLLYKLPMTPRTPQQSSQLVMVPSTSTPLPPTYRHHRLVYIPPEIHRDTTEPPSHSSITYFLPHTPKLLPLNDAANQLSAKTDKMHNVSAPPSSISMHGTSTVLRTFSGHYSAVKRRPDPSLGETLLGCTSLLIVGLVLLVLLYYLAS